MRRILPLFLVLFSLQAWSQSACPRKSSLFHFDPQMKPRFFTEKLGNHPQFPFLQRDSGVITRAAFLKAAKDPARHTPTFDHFRPLLQRLIAA